MRAKEIIDKYINFFKKNGHKQIANSSLVPENDPTTLFTSSGMQPLVPYLLGELHPQGTRLVNVQNSLRAVDIDEVGDNRHTTFFRMLGNWSLGNYFKKEQLPWLFEFLIKELRLDPNKLYISVFEGYKNITRDEESANLWGELFKDAGVDLKGRIFFCGTEDNWWSRAGKPENMPPGEPGGPDSEVYFDLRPQDGEIKGSFKELSDNGRLLEIGNSVFMQYKKQTDGSLKLLEKPNVDFGGGLERMIMAIENQSDVFKTTLFYPIIQTVVKKTDSNYAMNERSMRIITDHIVASCFIISAGVVPSNKEQGYILRRLIRRATDNLLQIHGMYEDIESIIESVVTQYKETDPVLTEKYEIIKNTIMEEQQRYKHIQDQARTYIIKKYPSRLGDELKGVKEISADDAFVLYTTHGLSPTQIRSLGYTFDKQAFAEKMEEHQKMSRKGVEKKFRGGLGDHEERTIMGHTATHLLHQALRDMLGKQVHQSGSNITTQRVRFDFNYERKLTDEEIDKLDDAVNKKIKENLPVHFELIPTKDAKNIGAIGLFMDTYGEKSKIYFIGGDSKSPERAYSIEFCGGPHVDFTGALKSFKIIKQENIGNRQRRLYAIVG